MPDNFDKARTFVDDWISNNVHPTGYADAEDAEALNGYAEMCLESAAKEGIKGETIEEAIGDTIAGHISSYIKQSIDAEVADKARRDD